jgi:hypothetical protein
VKAFTIVVSLFAAIVALPASAFEVISITPAGPSNTDVIHVAIASNPDCQQQALPPQRADNTFIVQIVFDPSVTNCDLAQRHFTFDIGPLPRGVYVFRTVRMVNGAPGLVTQLQFTVSAPAIVPTLSSLALLGLVFLLFVVSYAELRQRYHHCGADLAVNRTRRFVTPTWQASRGRAGYLVR